MRVLHTSDWHLGQSFFGESRAAEHRAFLSFLVDTCREERIEILLVCGDIFDAINPPAEAEEAWYSFLARLAREAPGVAVHVIAGNHDSPARLCAPRALLSGLGIEVHERLAFHDSGRTRLSADRHLRLLRPSRAGGGSSGSGGEAVFAFVPYARPAEIPAEYGAEGEKSLQDFLHGLYARALEDAARLYPGVSVILTGHLFAAGAALSELSERRIQRGNLEALPVSELAEACRYFALGHLHRAQALGPKGNARYCGSPLPLSFTEIDYPHQVVILDPCEPGSERIVRVPRARRLARLPRTHVSPEELLAAIEAFESPAEGELAPFVEACVLLSAPRPSLRLEIESALRAKGTRLLQLSVQRAGAGVVSGRLGTASNDDATGDHGNGSTPGRRDLRDFSALEIFERCHRESYGAAPNETMRATFLECLEAAQAEAAGGAAL